MLEPMTRAELVEALRGIETNIREVSRYIDGWPTRIAEDVCTLIARLEAEPEPNVLAEGWARSGFSGDDWIMEITPEKKAETDRRVRIVEVE